jgi:hypothetical protein
MEATQTSETVVSNRYPTRRNIKVGFSEADNEVQMRMELG